jgi:hypothetical protein
MPPKSKAAKKPAAKKPAAKKPAAKKTTKKWDKEDPRGPRPSPTDSAAAQEEDTEMLGNDGLTYVVKASRC